MENTKDLQAKGDAVVRYVISHEINKIYNWVGNLIQNEIYVSTIKTQYDERVDEINDLLEEVNGKIQELYSDIKNGQE